MVVRIAGERTYLWRAVDHEDEVVLSAPLVGVARSRGVELMSSIYCLYSTQDGITRYIGKMIAESENNEDDVRQLRAATRRVSGAMMMRLVS